MAVMFPIPGGSFRSMFVAYIQASPFVLLATGMVLGYNELTGYNLGYSKFAAGERLTVPGKVGMFLLYFPAAAVGGVFLAHWIGVLPALLKSCGASGVASLLESEQAAAAASDIRVLLVIVAVFGHFGKRDLEVLFLHKFSGRTDVGSTLFISCAYATVAATLLVTQVMSSGLSPPSLDLKWLGLATYLVGITGNGYHHWLLSQLRKHGNMGYVVPQGGLFGLLVCPHYVCEIVMFIGIALMSQTWCACATGTLAILYLTSRGIVTKQWYLKKVDGFPEGRRVLIPGVF